MTQNPPKIYLGDKFNSDTGIPLAEIPSVKTLGEILPETETQMKESFPDGGVYTGVVDRVFYYRRHYRHVYKNRSGQFVDETVTNKTFSYFWIDLRDSAGNVHHFTVDAEDETFQNLKKGDILTAICFNCVSLKYKIEGAEAQNTVSHDLMVCAAIVHDDTKNIPYINPFYFPKKQSDFSFTIVAGFVGFIAGWIAEEIIVGLFFGAVAALAACPIDILREKKRFKESEETFNIIESIMEKLLSVSRRDLGYEFPARPRHRTDVICIDCDSRISATFSYCVYCGANQTSPDIATANLSPDHSQKTLASIESDDVTTEMQLTKASSKDTASTNSVSVIEDALLEEFTIDYEQEYTQKTRFFFDEQAMVKVTCIMAKVLDRHNEVDVSHFSNRINGTYCVDIYRNYSDGSKEYDRSETRGYITTTNTRSSNMNTLFVLQLEGGKVIHTQLPDDMSADLDVGDWFVLAESTVEFNHQLSNREFAINLNKNKEYPCSHFEEYSEPTLFKEWSYTFVLIMAVSFVYKRDITYWMREKLSNTGLSKLANTIGFDSFFPIIIFLVLSIFVLFRTLSVRKQNRRNRQKVMVPLKELIGSLQAKTEQVKSTIKRIS